MKRVEFDELEFPEDDGPEAYRSPGGNSVLDELELDGFGVSPDDLSEMPDRLGPLPGITARTPKSARSLAAVDLDEHPLPQSVVKYLTPRSEEVMRNDLEDELEASKREAEEEMKRWLLELDEKAEAEVLQASSSPLASPMGKREEAIVVAQARSDAEKEMSLRLMTRSIQRWKNYDLSRCLLAWKKNRGFVSSEASSMKKEMSLRVMLQVLLRWMNLTLYSRLMTWSENVRAVTLQKSLSEEHLKANLALRKSLSEEHIEATKRVETERASQESQNTATIEKLTRERDSALRQLAKVSDQRDKLLAEKTEQEALWEQEKREQERNLSEAVKQLTQYAREREARSLADKEEISRALDAAIRQGGVQVFREVLHRWKLLGARRAVMTWALHAQTNTARLLARRNDKLCTGGVCTACLTDCVDGARCECCRALLAVDGGLLGSMEAMRNMRQAKHLDQAMQNSPEQDSDPKEPHLVMSRLQAGTTWLRGELDRIKEVDRAKKQADQLEAIAQETLKQMNRRVQRTMHPDAPESPEPISFPEVRVVEECDSRPERNPGLESQRGTATPAGPLPVAIQEQLEKEVTEVSVAPLPSLEEYIHRGINKIGRVLFRWRVIMCVSAVWTWRTGTLIEKREADKALEDATILMAHEEELFTSQAVHRDEVTKRDRELVRVREELASTTRELQETKARLDAVLEAKKRQKENKTPERSSQNKTSMIPSPNKAEQRNLQAQRDLMRASHNHIEKLERSVRQSSVASMGKVLHQWHQMRITRVIDEWKAGVILGKYDTQSVTEQRSRMLHRVLCRWQERQLQRLVAAWQRHWRISVQQSRVAAGNGVSTQTLGIRQLRAALGRWNQRDVSMRLRAWLECMRLQHQDRSLQQLQAYTAAIEKQTQHTSSFKTQVKQVKMEAGMQQLRRMLWQETKGDLRSRLFIWERQKKLEQTAEKQLRSLDAYTEAILKQTQLHAPLTRLNQSLMGLESLASETSSPIDGCKPGGIGVVQDPFFEAARLDDDKENIVPSPLVVSPTSNNTTDQMMTPTAAQSFWPDQNERRGLRQIGRILVQWRVITAVSAVWTWRNSASAALREAHLIQQHEIQKATWEDQHMREVERLQHHKLLAQQRAAEVDAVTQEWNAVQQELESARRDREILVLELRRKTLDSSQKQSDAPVSEAQGQVEGRGQIVGEHRMEELKKPGIELVTSLRASKMDQIASIPDPEDETKERQRRSTSQSPPNEHKESEELEATRSVKIELVEQQLEAATQAAQRAQHVESLETMNSELHEIETRIPASPVIDDAVVDEAYAAAERAYLEYSTEYLNVNMSTSVKEEATFHINELEQDHVVDRTPLSPIEHQLLHVQMELHGLSRSMNDSPTGPQDPSSPQGQGDILQHIAATLSMLPQTWPVPQLQGDNILGELMVSLQPRLDCVTASPAHQQMPMSDVGARFEALMQGLEQTDKDSLEAVIQGLQGIDAWAAELYGTLRGLAVYLQSEQAGGEVHGVEGILLEVARQIDCYPIHGLNPESSVDVEEWSSQLLTELTKQESSVPVPQENTKRELLLNLSEKAIQMKIALTTIIPWAQDCRAEAMIARKERDAAFLQRDGSMLQLEAQLEVIEAMEKEIRKSNTNQSTS